MARKLDCRFSMRTTITLLLALPLFACGNSYHPEYHPVTVTNVSQSYSSSVHVGGGGGAPQPVTVMPAPQTQPPIVIGPYTPEPPPGFFDEH